jgi:LPS export ABC transporter protein LptC
VYAARRTAAGKTNNQTNHIMAVMKKKKPNTLRIVLVLFILSVIAILAVVYINYRELLENPEKMIAAFKPGADMTIDDIHQTATRNGKKEWQLDAASAHYIDTEKKVRLEDLGMTFFLENQQQIQLTADSGILETETQNVSIKGQVKLKNEDANLQTEELHYQHEQRFIFADTPVTITGEVFQLNAESMTLDLEKGRAVFKGNVQATFNDDFSL